MKGGINMENGNKKQNIVIYFLKMCVLFVIIDFIISLIPGILSSSVLYFKYGVELITELFYGIFALIVMLLHHNSYVFTNKHSKFKDSLKFAIPMLVFSVGKLICNFIGLEGIIPGNFINIIIFCIFIGFAEEFLCRGWLQNEFVERFGDSKKGVIKSIICSSVIFGAMHLVNALTTSQGLLLTVFQVINAMSLGFYLGIIYYKTKNIWSVIFLHAFYDFALLISEVNMVKDCFVGNLSNEFIIASAFNIIMLSAFWIISSILVIKKCNFPDAKASRKKKTNALLLTAVIVFGILGFIPFEEFAEGYDSSYICYEYESYKIEEGYTTHFPHYDKYEMKYEKEEKSLVMSDENTNDVKEVITLNKYNITLELDLFGTLHIINNNTGYEKEFEEDITFFEVIENNDAFTILLSKDTIETTIYYSDYTIKNNMTDEDSFIDEIVDSFISYELPLINEIGYITIGESDYKYPMFYSDTYDYFIIKSGDLYLIK